jgi:hypothetical protein
MARSRGKRVPKTVLKLPDLEPSKSAVLNSLASASSKRSYDRAIREFIHGYCSEPRTFQPPRQSAEQLPLFNRYGVPILTCATLRVKAQLA